MSQAHRLFFAVCPDADARAHMLSARAQLCDTHGLRGRFVAPERLHVTLHWLSDHPELPVELLQRALSAGASVNAASFDVVFDRAECLRERGDLVVLSSSRGTGSLRRFQRALAAAMTDAGIGRHVRSGFKPHVSLIYESAGIERQPVVPVHWKVNEFVLIDSVVGKSEYRVLGRWTLPERQSGFDW